MNFDSGMPLKTFYDTTFLWSDINHISIILWSITGEISKSVNKCEVWQRRLTIQRKNISACPSNSLSPVPDFTLLSNSSPRIFTKHVNFWKFLKILGDLFRFNFNGFSLSNFPTCASAIDEIFSFVHFFGPGLVIFLLINYCDFSIIL